MRGLQENLKYDPFSGHVDENVDIYCRGTQDMKCLSIQYLEAIRRLKNNGHQSMPRTIHICFAPDEELGGANGLEAFMESEQFVILNVGFALNEGRASVNDVFTVAYAERNQQCKQCMIAYSAVYQSANMLYTYRFSSYVFINILPNVSFLYQEEQQFYIGKSTKCTLCCILRFVVMNFTLPNAFQNNCH
jgi:hypothetical protein